VHCAIEPRIRGNSKHGLRNVRDVRARRNPETRQGRRFGRGYRCQCWFFSAHLSAMVGTAGNVISIEPGRTPLQFLTQTVESCVYKNIQLCPSAVSSTCGQTTFYETEFILDKGYGRINERPSSKFEKIVEYPVEVLSPIAIFERYKLQNVSFIKIDIEGQEKNVVFGLEPVFKTYGTPTLMTEVTIEPRWHDDLIEYSEFLARFGYQMHRAVAGLPKISIGELRPGFYGNVFWIPPSTSENLCS